MLLAPWIGVLHSKVVALTWLMRSVYCLAKTMYSWPTYAYEIFATRAWTTPSQATRTQQCDLYCCAHPLVHHGEIEVDILRYLAGFGLNRVVLVYDPPVSGSGASTADSFNVASLARKMFPAQMKARASRRIGEELKLSKGRVKTMNWSSYARSWPPL